MSPVEIMSQASYPARSSGLSRQARLCIFGGSFLALVLIIVIPVSIALDRNAKESAAISALRTLVVDALKKENIDTSGFDDESTYQEKAFRWLYYNNPNLSSMDRTQVLQRYALAAFYYSTYQVATLYTPNPPIWVSSNRWLSTESACDWEGINCNSRDRVDRISLESNALTGKIPADLSLLREHLKELDLTTNLLYMETADLEFFGSLTKLETLLLDDNYILTEDGLPTSIGECTSLEKLRLSYNLMGGELPDDFFSKLTQLTHLEAESNFFSGSMPSSVGMLEALVYLYMRRNSMQFNLDFVKHGKLKNLYTMWLDANKLTGTIPTQIGELTALASLSLTNGTMRGRIPTEMGLLSDLRRVWMYNNTLQGQIPFSIQNLTRLEVFEVHHNDLSGFMPTRVCSTIKAQAYRLRSLTADCSKVSCSGCCTFCPTGS